MNGKKAKALRRQAAKEMPPTNRAFINTETGQYYTTDTRSYYRFLKKEKL